MKVRGDAAYWEWQRSASRGEEVPGNTYGDEGCQRAKATSRVLASHKQCDRRQRDPRRQSACVDAVQYKVANDPVDPRYSRDAG